MIETAICDDERYFAEELHRNVEKFFSERNIRSRITEFYSGKELSQVSRSFDLVFLDVRMDERDGFETAEQLRRNGFSGCLIFVTIMKEDMYRAFEFGALDYLVKPISDSVFERTMKRFLRSLNDAERALMITRKNEQSIIKLDSILYCEIIDRKIYLHLKNNDIIEYYDKISLLESKLGSDFFRSHRSYLVNIKHIAGYDQSEVILDSGEKIPLSRGRKNDLMNALLKTTGGDLE